MQSDLHRNFVLHFGEMGSRWGINRTVGQIYATIFLSEHAVCADDLVETLGISRSNVSMGLKELMAWNLLRIERHPGDRRDYFSTPEDLWEIVRTLIEERKKREIDPTLSMLRSLELDSGTDGYAGKRISEMREMIELMVEFHHDMNKLETERLVQLLKLGARVQKIAASTDKILPLRRKTARS